MSSTGLPVRIDEDGRPVYQAICDEPGCGFVCVEWKPAAGTVLPSEEKIHDMVGRSPQFCDQHAPVDQPPPPPPPPVPQSITPAQLRIAARRLFGITRENLDAAVAAVIAELATVDEQSAEDARDKWEKAVEIDRNHPLIVVVARGFGLSLTDIDNLFIFGASFV